jgi:hypothetical protein
MRICRPGRVNDVWYVLRAARIIDIFLPSFPFDENFSIVLKKWTALEALA